MGQPKLTLYVDILSPFAYMAYYLTRNSPAFQSLPITYIPILLGGLMQQAKNQPPLNILNKDKWINAERLRWSRAFNIPIAEETPSPFPQSTVNTQRALVYLWLKEPEGVLPRALDALYHAFWVERKTIGKVEVIAEVLGPVLGAEGTRRCLEGVKSEEVKQALVGNTKRSFEEGAFGLPWFVAENEKGEKEGFWGVDHMGQLLEFLGIEPSGEKGYKSLL
ncbi:hypothetical protein M409DRAFT_20910 [Zasmidium cellare ATCC 36951]|uniref:Glutathione S-transferase kappa n=1 Tax=Zasmidium cellare ATCC 36951 TaxID=1080233 RepID=A0A6A6CTU1_ZASCE|nr:uncharacterized protein M409DRAFT_20910 [Zasmidium cellare ATCC 36951]KAF2168896.1 hypothetical protein M409DRAFT_20910 [Zasmidium cellare ATCC 36951]